MWLTPSSTALRSTVIDRSRSLGVPRWKAALPVSRIAPNPMRLTDRSPSFQVPAASAVIVSGIIGGVSHTSGPAREPSGQEEGDIEHPVTTAGPMTAPAAGTESSRAQPSGLDSTALRWLNVSIE